MGGSLLWIYAALSTPRPSTSPHLSAIQLDFAYPGDIGRSLIEDTGNDLRRVADEVTRIEREFEGAVNVTVLRDPEFKMVTDALNVRFHSCRTGDTSRHC